MGGDGEIDDIHSKYLLTKTLDNVTWSWVTAYDRVTPALVHVSTMCRAEYYTAPIVTGESKVGSEKRKVERGLDDGGRYRGRWNEQQQKILGELRCK